PQFALQAGLAALDWMLKGHGYQVSSTDLSNAFAATLDAARQVGEEKQTLQTVREKIRQHASNEYDLADTLERLLNDAI
ncbi:hypothetical protein ACPXAZ_25565, partial [Escherichia coli]|uniref:hypothetical protein n=1 Tax=Escherichia coli TaxID=562 RepID=UPI003CE5ADEF